MAPVSGFGTMLPAALSGAAVPLLFNARLRMLKELFPAPTLEWA
jgi:hypothetical protein